MPLHMVKLCVGVESLAQLKGRLDQLRGRCPEGVALEVAITTKSSPKRASEMAGGSLYWVIKGQIVARQAILKIQTEGEGAASRCLLVLAGDLVEVSPRPRRAFQGWRYLEAGDAPADIGGGVTEGLDEMPEELRQELASLGLL